MGAPGEGQEEWRKPGNQSHRPTRAERVAHCAALRPVVELVILLSGKDSTTHSSVSTPEPSVASLVDELWSLQYQVPGVLCGAAGPCLISPRPPSNQDHKPQTWDLGVHFRFGSEQAACAFQQHSRFQTLWSAHVDKLCSSKLLAVFSSDVPAELEAIFRRGEDFQLGRRCAHTGEALGPPRILPVTWLVF
ncbi:hypothetical protein WJX72_003497 [[Myrmecia] bisecta]|uniref:Uncharacterized protein n=1 Tax=[Myrmecia] bisecta TaxID=41462 RepID=A0AAW1PE95_9CHLO